MPEAALRSAAEALARALMTPKSAHAATAAAALGHAGLRGPLPLPQGPASQDAHTNGSVEPAATAEIGASAAEPDLPAVLQAITALMSDKDIKVGCCRSACRPFQRCLLTVLAQKLSLFWTHAGRLEGCGGCRLHLSWGQLKQHADSCHRGPAGDRLQQVRAAACSCRRSLLLCLWRCALHSNPQDETAPAKSPQCRVQAGDSMQRTSRCCAGTGVDADTVLYTPWRSLADAHAASATAPAAPEAISFPIQKQGLCSPDPLQT